MSRYDDPGARRNRDEGGLWVINALVSMVVLVLSLYVFRGPETRQDAQAAIAAVGSLPDQLGPSRAMAATPEEPEPGR
jgi:hypothetical protein